MLPASGTMSTGQQTEAAGRIVKETFEQRKFAQSIVAVEGILDLWCRAQGRGLDTK